MTETPAAMTYANFVSSASVKIALMLASLNTLEDKCGNVMNAYITAPMTEKFWTILGPEFGADTENKAINHH